MGESIPLEDVTEHAYGRRREQHERASRANAAESTVSDVSLGEGEPAPCGVCACICAPVRGLLSSSKPRRIRWAFRLLYAAVAMVALAVVGYAMARVVLTRSNATYAAIAWFAGGLCTAASTMVSFYGIILHLDNYSRPRLQRWVVRVLWMVPVYSLCSFASLSLYLEPLCSSRFKWHNKYIVFDTIRDFYEAFTIFCFLRLCLEWLEEAIPGGDAVFRIAQRPAKRFMPPYAHAQPVGTGFLNFCRTGTMDYVVVQAVSSTVTLVAVLASGSKGAYGIFGQGELFNFRTFYPYIVLLKSAAQAWAIWCLTLLYRMTAVDLEPLKPLGKFLCIKMIVFFTFWQSVLWSLLVAVGIISDEPGCSHKNPAQSELFAHQRNDSMSTGMATLGAVLIHDAGNGTATADSGDPANFSDCAKCAKDRVAVYDHLLICLEMLGFALVHLKTFPWSDFRNDTLAQLRSAGALGTGVRAMFDVSDVYEEMRARVGQYRMPGSDLLSRIFGRNRNTWRQQRNSNEPLLSPDFPSDDF